MVFRPSQGPVQLIVLGTTRLDSYYLDTGESRWWMPVGTAGSLGTPVAAGSTLFVSTLSSSEPMMPAFASVLTMYDKDHDGRLSHDEFKGDKELGEHFGWIDGNSDGFITEAEWNKARSLGTGDFGAIAATNAISDVYAMGGTPLFALALVGMPIDKLPVATIRSILAGGEAVCAKAGIPVAGGHTIDSVEPIYGLVVMGLVHPDKVRRNADAKAGDVLVLGKPIGVGVLSAALKKNALDASGYKQLVETTTRLNTPGMALADMPGVHGITDVTGFGLAGHALEMARGAGLGVTIEWSKVPLLDGVAGMARDGFITGASGRNWAGYGHDVDLGPAIGDAERALLSDPQTSGGLLVACARDHAGEVLALFHAEGFAQVQVIGEVSSGVPRVTVR
jgi:selenide,water dikinase